MLAFEVIINDERMCVAGMEDWAVMSVILSGVRSRHRGPNDDGWVDVSVTGLSETDASGVSHHARWGRIDLEVGSKVTINLIDTAQPDPPVRRFRSDREVQEPSFTEEEIEEMERADWLRLKAKFEPASGHPSSD